MTPEPRSKGSSQIWSDFLESTIGFDRGYLFTLKGVYKNPQEVVESYFDDRGKYLSPFATLGFSFSAYYLISGLLVDWEAVGASLDSAMMQLLEWEATLLGATGEQQTQVLNKVHDSMVGPMIQVLMSILSKYLIVIVLPIQFIALYFTARFTRDIGIGFYHHFVAINYFLSLSLLSLDIIIMLGLISPWLMIPSVVVFNYFLYGLWFNSYGDKKPVVRKAIMKGFAVTLALVFAFSAIVGLAWGRLG